MTAIVTNDVRVLHSENFVNSIKNNDQTLYSFLGKSDEWSANSSLTPINSNERFRADSLDISVMERVYYQNLSRVSKYVAHTTDTVYSMYDDSKDMAGLSYFVVNPATKGVYKCLFNNPTGANPTGSPSTSIPDSVTTTGVQTTVDNYVWKYMYTIPTTWGEPIVTDTSSWMSIKNVLTREENSSQWDVRLNTLPGGIHAFRWKSTPDASLLPDDSVITVVGNTGSGSFVGKVLNGIVICDPLKDSSTNPGFGYTSFTDVLVDGQSVDFIEPIISPIGGHGSNPVVELNGYHILIDSTLINTTNSVINFRKIGLIYNPLRKTRSNGESNEITHISSSGIVTGERLGAKTAFTMDENTSEYMRHSGKIIYIENLSNADSESITAGSGIKQIKMILSF